MSKAIAIPGCNKDIGGMREEISLSPTEKKDGAIGLFSRLLRFDSLSKRNNSTGSPTSTEPPQTYYGVYIPCELKKGPDEETLHVYKNKSEALEVVRRYKQSRFKAFQNHQDAVSFALRGAEVEHTDENNSLMGEKPLPFKAPSPQDGVLLRKAIEGGLTATVRARVWDNPRFLVSSGNTPVILQEGSRYNALHVAAKAMNAEICNLVLTTVGNPEFVQSLYGVDADCCKEFACILLDRYLNTPDKAMNETPLHFAAKFGAEEVVDVLTSFPQCDKEAVNKFGEKPRDVVCNRAPKSTPEQKKRISAMLEERFYVPVLHSEDDSGPPTIGRPFTPAAPPELNSDPLSPRYEIRAFAGPMVADCAESFRKRWKTPERQPPKGRVRPPMFRLNDKGLESVGRNLAEEMKVGWKEYWPFLDTFTDFRTPEGLSLLENYLRAKYESACSFAYNESCAEANYYPEDLSLSRISLNISQMSPPKESAMSPMSELCAALKTCTISNERPAHWRKTDPIRQRLCRQPNKLNSLTNGEAAPPTNHTVSQLLCIERTCQVFAKRIVDALIFSLTAEPDIAEESLKSEAKNLQHTMFTFMDDERYQKIDFGLIHSRLAQLVVFKLKQQSIELDDINHFIEFLMNLRCPNDDIFSSDDERKPVLKGPNRVRVNHVIDSHVRCLASFISEELVESDATKGPSVSESECTEIWDKVSKCRCDWKIEVFDRNSKKNASFRKNRSILSSSPKNDSVIKRLSFLDDAGDGKTQTTEAEKPVSINSPAGDTGCGADKTPSVFTVAMDKCQVVDAEIMSDDDSAASRSDDDEVYLTASEHSGDDADLMHDASDRAAVEPFIYGEEPSKMDRLVFDAISQCQINCDDFPNIFRWRHTVALYSPSERDRWQPAPLLDDSTASAITYSFNLGQTLAQTSLRRGRRSSRNSPTIDNCSTPKKDSSLNADNSRGNVSLQVSNWLRVTGPNSPRSSPASKNVGYNVSFGC